MVNRQSTYALQMGRGEKFTDDIRTQPQCSPRRVQSSRRCGCSSGGGRIGRGGHTALVKEPYLARNELSGSIAKITESIGLEAHIPLS